MQAEAVIISSQPAAGQQHSLFAGTMRVSNAAFSFFVFFLRFP